MELCDAQADHHSRLFLKAAAYELLSFIHIGKQSQSEKTGILLHIDVPLTKLQRDYNIYDSHLAQVGLITATTIADNMLSR